MSPNEAQSRIRQLRAEIALSENGQQQLEIADFSGDQLKRLKLELEKLEAEFPLSATHESHAEQAKGEKTEALNEEIKNLRLKIEHHNRLYYQKGAQEISDFEYDQLVKRLEKLEKRKASKTPVIRRLPELPIEDSPTAQVGDDRTQGFVEVAHREKMMSLDNTYNEKELRAFHSRLTKLIGSGDLAYTVEPKIDGLAVSLTYEKGQLVRALTRGKGDRGDDVTANVRTIASLPVLLNGKAPPKIAEIRGEIYLTSSEFERINKERVVAGEALYANPRNLAAGTLKLLDSSEVAHRRLDIVLYGLGYCDPLVVKSQSELHDQLRSWGLPVVEHMSRARGIDEVWAAVQGLDQLRHTFPYATDGAVVKIDLFEQQNSVGKTAKAPRWAIAYKFKADTVLTRLLGITIQVGKTGILSPVAELEPVLLAGSTISRATLHNEDEIRRKDIRVGDLIEIEKAGEVIPAVLRSFAAERPAGAVEFDLFAEVHGQCPVCASKIARVEVADEEARGVAWKCMNYDCSAQRMGRLEFFCSRRALAIDGVGETVAGKLVELGLVKHVLDLYDISSETLAVLNLGTATEPRIFGEKNAAKIVLAREAARALPLARWLYSFAIPDVGEETARDIAKLHDDIEAVAASTILRDIAKLQKLNQAMLRNSPQTDQNKGKSKAERDAMKPVYDDYKKQADDLGMRLIELGHARPAKKKTPPPRDAVTVVGPIAAQSAIEWFDGDAGRETLSRLRVLGIFPKANHLDNKQSAFAGKIVVLTGTITAMSRNEAEEKIRIGGGAVAKTVSKKTDMVVAGPGAGSKLEDAQKYGVQVIDEAEFLRLLKMA